MLRIKMLVSALARLQLSGLRILTCFRLSRKGMLWRYFRRVGARFSCFPGPDSCLGYGEWLPLSRGRAAWPGPRSGAKRP